MIERKLDDVFCWFVFGFGDPGSMRTDIDVDCRRLVLSLVCCFANSYEMEIMNNSVETKIW